jgi:hypothetical protein
MTSFSLNTYVDKWVRFSTRHPAQAAAIARQSATIILRVQDTARAAK